MQCRCRLLAGAGAAGGEAGCREASLQVPLVAVGSSLVSLGWVEMRCFFFLVAFRETPPKKEGKKQKKKEGRRQKEGLVW